MALLKKADMNEQAYLKAGVLGFAGSGKTYTSTMLTIGIAKKLADNKPVAFFDTETGSDFLIPRFETEGIELMRAKSQSFSDLLEVGKEAEQSCSVLIVDSITHVWRGLCDAYQAKTKYNRLQFNDWAVIKNEWARWTEFFLNSKIHIVISGRAGYEYDFEEDDRGKKELIKTGTKMKVENEFGFEPSLLIEMERANRSGEVGSGWIHKAHVLKDRTDRINGKCFEFQKLGETYNEGDYSLVFDCFKPVLESLNIGGEHKGFENTNNDQDRFTASGETDRSKYKVQIEITLEEIQAYLVKAYPGQDAKSKALKLAIIENVFDTTSWKAVSIKKLPELSDGLMIIKSIYDSLSPDVTPEEIQSMVLQAREALFSVKEDSSSTIGAE